MPARVDARRPLKPKVVLERLASFCDPSADPDRYGSGEIVERFERRIADELGKEAAVFMPTGTMAQQIALRIWSDHRGTKTIAFHPTSHLALHESQAYTALHGLQALHIGSPVRLMTADDVAAIPERLAALLYEIPQRELGAQLAPWDDLVELLTVARAKGGALHLDGARLWEAAPHYRRSHAEIAALFDSVYVSFYKGLGAIAGAALAGDAAFIAEARVWQHRHGGRLVSAYPLVLSAENCFQTRLPLMKGFYERACVLGPKLAGIRGVDLVPNPPHTNTFHLFLHGDRDALEARAHRLAEESGIWSFGQLAPTVNPLVHKWEFVVMTATLSLDDDAIVSHVAQIVG